MHANDAYVTRKLTAPAQPAAVAVQPVSYPVYYPAAVFGGFGGGCSSCRR